MNGGWEKEWSLSTVKFWIARMGEGRQNREPAQRGTGRAVAGARCGEELQAGSISSTHSLLPICLGLDSEALDNKGKMERKINYI